MAKASRPKPGIPCKNAACKTQREIITELKVELVELRKKCNGFETMYYAATQGRHVAETKLKQVSSEMRAPAGMEMLCDLTYMEKQRLKGLNK